MILKINYIKIVEKFKILSYERVKVKNNRRKNRIK